MYMYWTKPFLLKSDHILCETVKTNGRWCSECISLNSRSYDCQTFYLTIVPNLIQIQCYGYGLIFVHVYYSNSQC